VRGELDGVAQQVQQNLTEMAPIEHDASGNLGRDPHREKQSFSACGFADNVFQVDGQLRQIGRFGSTAQQEQAKAILAKARDELYAVLAQPRTDDDTEA